MAKPLPATARRLESGMDPLAINETFLHLNAAWMRAPEAWLASCRSLGEAMQSVGGAVAAHLGENPPEPSKGGGKALIDWADALAWTSRQYHGAIESWLTDYVDQAPELDAEVRQCAHFWVRQIVAMTAPANFFWSNPRAVQRLIQSNGESLLNGIRAWARDARNGSPLPALADRRAFAVGTDLAATPGQVVHRNPLVEIIQYAPRTDRVRQVPIVLIQPWINKYYIFDLSAHNSLVRYLTEKGYTVFITSWKNPTAAMADTRFEDYMRRGALQAIETAREITGSDRVHAAGYCIGGTLLAALLGWLVHDAKPLPVADATLFATLLDFSQPGDMRAFVNPTAVKAVEQVLTAQGVLPSAQLAFTFRLLNPGDLIWRNMIARYFYGDAPPRSDMLYWNSDSTNLPGAMCRAYLKAFYLENRLARADALVLDGRPIDLKRVDIPLYVVGAQKDHICPWEATFQSCHLTSGPVRYVLSNEGHITGIVDPPSRWSKKKFWAGAATRRRDGGKWLRNKKAAVGSWWGDWLVWLDPRSGAEGAPPGMGSARYRPLEPAPGRYVHE